VLFIDQYEQFRDAYYEQHMADFNRLSMKDARQVFIW